MTFPVLNFRASAWKPLALVSALSAIFVSPSYSQTDDVKTLASVVVTAARIEQSQTEALPHTTVITKEMIRDRQATDVPSLLRSEAGIDITQSGGAGTQTSLFMRGTNSNQSLILIDGIPVRDPSTPGGTAMAIEHLLPDQIERIEIVRGNVSAIYGSGAMGGVIQIITKRGEGPPTVTLSVEAGSRDTSKFSGTVSGQSGGTRYMLSATSFRTDGFSTMNTTQFPSENPDKDGDRNVSLAAALSQEWSKGNELGARIYSFNAKYNTDGGGWGTQTQVDTGKSKQDTIAIFSKNRIASNWLSTITASQTEIDRETSTVGGWSPGTYSYKGTTDLLQWTNEVMLSPNWVMTAGVDGAREKTNDYSSAISRSNSSLYAGFNGKLDAHSFQLNVRNDHVGGSGSDTTGYVGYGYALSSSWKAIASASTAFLAPTLYQLHMPASWGGNPDLKPERSRSYEIGMQYAAGATLVRAVLFDSHTRDLIQADTNDPNWKLINIASASNRGFELSGSGRVAGIDMRASLTLQDPVDDATGETLNRRAKKLASLGLSKTVGSWRFGGDVQYAGERKDGTHELSSYAVVNLNARYQINKQVSLYGRIDNLFDRDYQTVYGYNQAPLGVFAGIEWRNR